MPEEQSVVRVLASMASHCMRQSLSLCQMGELEAEIVPYESPPAE